VPAEGPDPALPRPLPEPSWIERLRALAASPARLAAGAAVLAVAVVAGVFLLRSPAPPPEDSLPMASTASPGSSGPSGAAAPAGEVVVQAAGAVVHPGVYHLPAGSRVTDLVAAAGGLAAGADPDRINLAAVLVDGARVYVPRVGEAMPAATGSGGGGPDTPPEPVDLNTASVADLDTLPGIGPTTAQAIVDYRSAHGRFRAVDDLLEVRGIGPAKLEEIRPRVRV
jgi:competence protein ComEA